MLPRLPPPLPSQAAAPGGRAAPRCDASLEHAAERLYAEAGGAQEGAARLGEAVRASLGRLVSRSSTPQTVKGFLTGGAVTTARYVGAKLAKRLVRK